MATALFRDGELSLARAARVAQMETSAFSSHLSRLGIPVIRLSEAETNADLDTLEQWLQSSSAITGAVDCRHGRGHRNRAPE
jgi:predicted HTH domain antitoxin